MNIHMVLVEIKITIGDILTYWINVTQSGLLRMTQPGISSHGGVKKNNLPKSNCDFSYCQGNYFEDLLLGVAAGRLAFKSAKTYTYAHRFQTYLHKTLIERMPRCLQYIC